MPEGWFAINEGNANLSISESFTSPDAAAGTYNAGPILGGTNDRTLAIGVPDSTENNALGFNVQIINSDVHAVRLQFDLEAWAGSPIAEGSGEADQLILIVSP